MQIILWTPMYGSRRRSASLLLIVLSPAGLAHHRGREHGTCKKISDSSDNGRVMEAVASWSFSEIHYLEIYCPNFVMLQCSYDNLRETRFSSKFCIWQNFFFVFLSHRQSLKTGERNLVDYCQKSNLKFKKQNLQPEIHKSTHEIVFLIPDGMADWTAWGMQFNRAIQLFLTENWQ